MLTPWDLSCSIFLNTAASFVSILFPFNLIVFKYFPTWAFVKSLTNIELILLPDKSSTFTKLLLTSSSTFLASVLVIAKFLADISRIWVSILFISPMFWITNWLLDPIALILLIPDVDNVLLDFKLILSYSILIFVTFVRPVSQSSKSFSFTTNVSVWEHFLEGELKSIRSSSSTKTSIFLLLEMN